MKIEIDRTTLSYHEIGEGRPLLAIHGWTTDHQYIRNILEPTFEKRRGWKRIYVDLPGRGQSPASDRIKSSHDELNLLLKFIQARLNEQRFALVGMSYGGLLARGVLMHRMESIDGLALIVPSIEADRSHRKNLPPRTVLVRDETAIQSLQPGETDGVFENSLVIQDKRALERLREHFFPSVSMTDQAFLERLSENYGFPFDVDELPVPFNRPTLFLLGRQDHVVGYRSAFDLLDRYPRATFAILDRAGHFLGGIEQVALSQILISAWLDRLEAYPSQT